ncbi:hypothetical protein L4C34_02855 [Vibrio profundum]|uniref:hypothetical protein n=1 Tax=Vibrio profundum TaxID=2910247 RepID=UPI003D0CD9C5
MRQWLITTGLVIGTPHKVDEKKQHNFIKHCDELKGTSHPILFLDAIHPTQATKISYGWNRKGEDKAMETTKSHSRMNLVGTLALDEIGNTWLKVTIQ